MVISKLLQSSLRLVSLAIFLLGVQAFAAGSSEVVNLGPLSVGQALAEFTGIDMSQKGLVVVNKADLLDWTKTAGADARAVVVFFSTSCLPCMEGLAQLQKHSEELSRAGSVVLLVALDPERSKVREFLAKQGLKFHSINDPEGTLARKCGVVYDEAGQVQQRIPTTLILDAKGKVTQIITAEGADYLSIVEGRK